MNGISLALAAVIFALVVLAGVAHVVNNLTVGVMP